jgi:hypothetical protein
MTKSGLFYRFPRGNRQLRFCLLFCLALSGVVFGVRRFAAPTAASPLLVPP